MDGKAREAEDDGPDDEVREHPGWTLISVDLGNSGVRLHLGAIDAGERLRIREIHSFEHHPVRIDERWYWDFLAIWQGILAGLAKAAPLLRSRATLGIACFGVDYALLDARDLPVGAVRNMRDPRTAGLFAELYARVPRTELYRRTGAMEIEITTLMQLLADQRDQPWLFDVASALHLLPDYLAFLLTGRRIAEVSIASTSQLLDPGRRDWDLELVTRLGLPERLFGPVVEPGTPVGPVRPAEARRLGFTVPLDFVAAASHDTASAAAAVPYEDEASAAFISLGTWALVGRSIAAPDRSDASMAANFTNECGADGRVIHHKIQAGLWLMQEVRRVLAERGEPVGFSDLEAAAAGAPPLAHIFDPDNGMFRDPESMPDAIGAWFGERGLPTPASRGALARAIYESVALACAESMTLVERLSGVPVTTIHIVGGGGRIALLAQAIADASGRRVLAGPAEATVAGIMIAQLAARGSLATFAAGRDLVRRSFEVVEYRPRDQEAWQAALETFRARRGGRLVTDR